MILNKLFSSIPSTTGRLHLQPTSVIQIAERYRVGKFWLKRPKELKNVRMNSMRKYLIRDHKKKEILKKILADKPILANTW